MQEGETGTGPGREMIAKQPVFFRYLIHGIMAGNVRLQKQREQTG